MSARDFEAALNAPDDDTSHKRLYQLITEPIASAALSSVAQRCLHTFCDDQSSVIKRRWVGLKLLQMIEKSADTVKQLKRSPRDFTQLGEVILRKDEAEESRIMAGLIIRGCLARGVKYPSFWTCDNVPNSAPNFPRDAGPKWMVQFQDFLDILDSLKLVKGANPVTDPFVLYAVSLIASDGYKWSSLDGAIPLLFIQGELMTIIVPSADLKDIGFVDIALDRIQSTVCEKSLLHDSQGIMTEYEPWNTVLKFISSSWTFRVNCTDHDAREFTILFHQQKDANECKSAINDFLHPSSPARSEPTDSVESNPQEEPKSGNLCSTSPISFDRSDQILDKEGARRGPYHAERALLGVQAETEPANRTSASRGKRSNATKTPRSSAPEHATKSQTADEQEERPSTISSKSASRTVEYDERDGEHGSTTTVQQKRPQRRPGTIPTVTRPLAPGANAHRLPLAQSKDTAFEFPDESPRIKRPSAVKKKEALEISRPSANSSQTAKVMSKPKPIGPKPPFQSQEVHDTEDEEDPLSSQQLQPAAQRRLSQPQIVNGVLKEQSANSSNVPKSSFLPKITKPTATQSRPKPTESDVFAIPPDAGAKPSARRKARKSVTYREASSSDVESSGSDYIASRTTKARAPVKRPPTSKSMKSKKADSSSQLKKRAGDKSTRSLNVGTGQLSSQKTTLLSNLQSKPQQTSTTGRKPLKARSAMQNAAHDKDIALPIAKERVDKHSNRPDHPEPSSEVNILDKLNDHEEMDEDGVDVRDSPLHANGTLQRKRTPDSSPPSTPRSKRAKKEHDSMDHNPEQAGCATTNPPRTIAPPRVLADPSSPCKRQSQSLGSRLIKKPERGMQASANHPVNISTHVASPGRRGRTLQQSGYRPERRRTPMHQQSKRTHSGGSANQQILSSNSKPTPASPHAESTAISGHAERQHVDMEKALGEHKIEKSDPFNHRLVSQRMTAFTRRLTGELAEGDNAAPAEGASQERPIEVDDNDSSSSSETDDIDIMKPPAAPKKSLAASKTTSNAEITITEPSKRATAHAGEVSNATKSPTAEPDLDITMEDSIRNPPQQLIEETQLVELHAHANDVDMEGDTLVEPDEEQLPTQKTSPVHFRSSPPPLGDSPSSHSSTSAEAEPRTEPPMPTSEAEEMEWEGSLKPHQRNLQDQLLRVSNRVLRHIVDNETAVDDIADMYATDGQHLLQSLMDRHNGEFEDMFKDIEQKKGSMKDASKELLKRLGRDRQSILDDGAS